MPPRATTAADSAPPPPSAASPSARTHWRRQLRLTFVLLSIWFLAGPVVSILFVERMNELSLGGIPFGFWMAQQGSIYVFVALIFVYAWLSDRNDRAAGAARTGDAAGRGGGGSGGDESGWDGAGSSGDGAGRSGARPRGDGVRRGGAGSSGDAAGRGGAGPRADAGGSGRARPPSTGTDAD